MKIREDIIELRSKKENSVGKYINKKYQGNNEISSTHVATQYSNMPA
ncbi:hypothetical protein [Photorhabdus stackebrandtii]|nr:hypothetical protein [Photorhabdus stackebrandtii]